MADLRAITLTWDPDSCEQVEVALGPGVSVGEAHHVLAATVDDIECLCPGARITRAGIELGVVDDGGDEAEGA